MIHTPSKNLNLLFFLINFYKSIDDDKIKIMITTFFLIMKEWGRWMGW